MYVLDILRASLGTSASTSVAVLAATFLGPLGYVCEYPIKTKGHGTARRPPTSYKADYAHASLRIAVELDGPCHASRKQQGKDRKKDEVLQALGWRVVRIPHSSAVTLEGMGRKLRAIGILG